MAGTCRTTSDTPPVTVPALAAQHSALTFTCVKRPGRGECGTRWDSTTSTGAPVRSSWPARAPGTSGLPLPADVGEAIAGYLRRGRPSRAAACSCESSPASGADPGGVTQVAFGAATVPVWARSTRTGSVTAQPARCCERAHPSRDRPGPPAWAGVDHRYLRQGQHRSVALHRAAVDGESPGRSQWPLTADYLALRRSLG